jgi:hypothetical protein
MLGEMLDICTVPNKFHHPRLFYYQIPRKGKNCPRSERVKTKLETIRKYGVILHSAASGPRRGFLRDLGDSSGAENPLFGAIGQCFRVRWPIVERGGVETARIPFSFSLEIVRESGVAFFPYFRGGGSKNVEGSAAVTAAGRH